MKLVITEYRKDDIYKVIDTELFTKFEIPFIDAINPDLTWTAIAADYSLVGCGGFRKFWQGVYEAWIAVKSYELFFKHKIQIIKFVKRKLQDIPAHRIQAAILKKNEKDVLFIELLGFQLEGVFRKYSPDGDDYCIYSMVK